MPLRTTLDAVYCGDQLRCNKRRAFWVPNSSYNRVFLVDLLKPLGFDLVDWGS
jgi:hypothetical protein